MRARTRVRYERDVRSTVDRSLWTSCQPRNYINPVVGDEDGDPARKRRHEANDRRRRSTRNVPLSLFLLKRQTGLEFPISFRSVHSLDFPLLIKREERAGPPLPLTERHLSDNVTLSDDACNQGIAIALISAEATTDAARPIYNPLALRASRKGVILVGKRPLGGLGRAKKRRRKLSASQDASFRRLSDAARGNGSR